MQVGFLGGGNMAKAIIKGLISSGVAHEDITVAEIDANARKALTKMRVENSKNVDILEGADVVVLAVKPQDLKQALNHVFFKNKNPLIISIAAGIRVETLRRWIGSHARIARVMPNLPALIGAGVSGVYAGSEVFRSDRLITDKIMGAVGECYWVEEESLLDTVTALSGSGPAYVFYFIEKLESIGVELGLDKKVSHDLTVNTFLGALKLVLESDDTPALLREKVTSKGGTTESALSVFAQENVAKIFKKALVAAKDRAKEMGKANDNQSRI